MLMRHLSHLQFNQKSPPNMDLMSPKPTPHRKVSSMNILNFVETINADI
jgi:hypothetical protein